MNDKNHEVSFYSILKTFSAAMDLISEEVVGHHRQVAYIAYIIGKEMELSGDKLKKLIISALIHDVGVFYLNQNFKDLNFDSPNDFHAEVGYHLLKKHFPYEGIAEIIKYHHYEWYKYPEDKPEEDYVILANILYLSDRVATLVNGRNILARKEKIVKKIKSKSGSWFFPEAVDSFLRVSEREYFWLDMISTWRIKRVLDNTSYLYDIKLNMDQLLKFSEIISHIIDYRSPFTATHSNGVAVLAEKMGDYLGFCKEECKMLKLAGFVHDIGKLAVPVDILNKPAALTNEEWGIMRSHSYYTYCVLDESDDLKTVKEWASYHHERLRGDGYPFHLAAEDLSMGSRIMAVVDVFTGITEDRPYRKGMKREKVLLILDDMVEDNILDKDVVGILKENYCNMDKLRVKVQHKARKKYQEFKQLIEKKKEEARKSKLEGVV